MINESIISGFEPNLCADESGRFDAALHRLCASCGYELRGLPHHGECPECGHAYDSQTLVLCGWPGRTRNPVARNADHARRGFMAWSVLGVSICGALLFNQETEQAVTMALLFGPIILAYGSLASLSQDQPGPAKAQIGPEGIGQRDDFGRMRNSKWSHRHHVRVDRISPEELRVMVQDFRFGIPLNTPVDVVIKTRIDARELIERIESIKGSGLRFVI